MESISEFTDRMRRLEQLACPTPEDVAFFNTQIRDLEPDSTYRENLENTVRLRAGGSD